MEKNKISGSFWLVSIGVCCLLLIIVIVGFIAFSNRKGEVMENEENGGNLVLNYTGNTSGLYLENIIPTTDTIAKSSLKDGEYLDFSVSTELDNATVIDYELALVIVSSKTTITNADLKVYLEQEKSGTYTAVFEPKAFEGLKSKSELGAPLGSMILTSVKKSKSGDDNYRLRVWLADTSLLEKGNVEVELKLFGNAK